MIKQRELHKREQLEVERQLFEQRTNLRQVKQNLPDQYKQGDEDILINQKVKAMLSALPSVALTTWAAKKEASRDYSADAKHPITAKTRWQTSRLRPAPSC